MITDWTLAAVMVQCAAQGCPLTEKPDRLIEAYELAEQHARETGHEVEVYLSSKRTVSRDAG
jgi:hypothetical protein